jgi:transposase-like protein
MVALVRRGKSQREVARRFGVTLRTVQRWLDRAGERPLASVDWRARSHAPRGVANKTDAALEREICALRKRLATESTLGFVGAQAIHEALLGQPQLPTVPSERTIGRILRRNGLLDARQRVRRAAPPPAWYLPAAAQQLAEIDSFDVIEDLRMEGFGLFQVFTARALWGPVVSAWPALVASTSFVLDALQAHWRQHGLPTFAQFDNDVRFQGGHNHPDVIGRVMRLCLALEVTPVFAPPLEAGFQAIIENFNGLWQQKVWVRCHHENLAALTAFSDRFIRAYAQRLGRRHDHQPTRRAFPQKLALDWQSRPKGNIIYLRRTSESGAVKVLGHVLRIDPLWPHRLVRCEVDLDQQQIRCYRLRRREPSDQPLIATLPYTLPQHRFDTRQRHKHPVTPIP